MPRSLLVAALVCAVSLPAASHAELVVMVDGSVLHVEEARANGDRMRLVLDNGGALVLPLLRVERVVADEIDRSSPAAGGELDWLPAVDISVRFPDDARAPEIPFGDIIFESARRHDLNPALVAAVVRAESAFDPRAVSIKGARGLMQLMPATALRFGLHETEVLVPERNVDAGTRYLRWLADRFEERVPLMLAGYNAGEGTVERYAGVPPYRETRDYLRRIYTDLASR